MMVSILSEDEQIHHAEVVLRDALGELATAMSKVSQAHRGLAMLREVRAHKAEMAARESLEKGKE